VETNTKSNVGNLFIKIKRVFLILLILFIGVFIYWKYFFTYSDGYRAGLLQKFSHKGNIFKTYEGEIILSSVTSTTNVALASEKFLFSVKDENLASRIDTLQGQFIMVHYFEKNGRLPWQGETCYFVDSVKVIPR
jgi:hypothetical protein